jgi:hypothetical protein
LSQHFQKREFDYKFSRKTSSNWEEKNLDIIIIAAEFGIFCYKDLKNKENQEILRNFVFK